jgi:hypothetical protein
VFHAARACLTLRGLHPKTHSGLIELFTQSYWHATELKELFDLPAARRLRTREVRGHVRETCGACRARSRIHRPLPQGHRGSRRARPRPARPAAGPLSGGAVT